MEEFAVTQSRSINTRSLVLHNLVACCGETSHKGTIAPKSLVRYTRHTVMDARLLPDVLRL